MLEDCVCVPEYVIFLKIKVLKRISANPTGEAELDPGEAFLSGIAIRFGFHVGCREGGRGNLGTGWPCQGSLRAAAVFPAQPWGHCPGQSDPFRNSDNLSQSLNLVSPAAGAVTHLRGWDRADPAAAQHWLSAGNSLRLLRFPQCCCPGVCWDKYSPLSTSVIDVYGTFVKCHLLGFFFSVYIDGIFFFLVWQFFLVNLFLIKKKTKTKQNVFLYMPPSMELSVICLCTCQGYTIGDKEPKCDTIITELGSVKGMGSVPLVNSSLWHIGILMMFYFGLRTFSAWIFVNTGMKHWDFEDKWCVLS